MERVAVTGASGYTGSWIVKDLVDHGYHVHACVRDSSRGDKVGHLLALNQDGEPECVTLFEADLFEPGSYDAAFQGCVAVVHAGATVGYNKETPRQVYDGCGVALEHVLGSVKKAAGIRTVVFTSSGAAMLRPRDADHVYTEEDWCDEVPDGEPLFWKGTIDSSRDVAYSLGKAKAERMCFAAADESGGQFKAFSVLPSHVLGPLMCENHHQPGSWQNCIQRMLSGTPKWRIPGGRMLWNIVDVRDVAAIHRYCIEQSATLESGQRFLAAAFDESFTMLTHELQTKLKELVPQVPNIAGEDMVDGKPAQPTTPLISTFATKAAKVLGFTPTPLDATLCDTATSLIRLGLVPTAVSPKQSSS
eukprot:m.205521 g.205521  ORF g.205521 m.205521 type:complete len:361 (+) comp15015_c1_seq1:112-1194(+)